MGPVCGARGDATPVNPGAYLRSRAEPVRNRPVYTPLSAPVESLKRSVGTPHQTEPPHTEIGHGYVRHHLQVTARGKATADPARQQHRQIVMGVAVPVERPLQSS